MLIVTGFLVELGVALSSYVTAVWQLYLSFAVIGCIGAGGFWIPATAVVMRWFKEPRPLCFAEKRRGESKSVLERSDSTALRTKILALTQGEAERLRIGFTQFGCG